MHSEEQASCKSRIDEIGDKRLHVSSEILKELNNIQRTTVLLGNQLTEAFAATRVGRDESLAEIRAGLSNLLSKMEALPKTKNAENEILKRLYFPSIHAREDVIADTEFGTFDWLLEDDRSMSEENESLSDEETMALYPYWEEWMQKRDDQLRCQTRQSFLSWLETGNQIYHVSGKAGAGKSTLMKFLCQDSRIQDRLDRWAGGKKLVFASFFFWNSGDKEQKSLEGLYRSLLFETLKQCPELIREVFPSHWTSNDLDLSSLNGMSFRISELKNLITGRHSFPNHRFCFFIDGLDEFETDLNTDHWELAQVLRKCAVSDDIKICVSSRPHEEFLQGFGPKLRMHLHVLTRRDVQRFIHGMLASMLCNGC